MRKVFSLLVVSAIMAGFTMLSWFLYGIFAGSSPVGTPLFSDIIPGGIAHSKTAECTVAAGLFALLYIWGNLPFVEKYDDGDSYLVTPAIAAWFGSIVSVIGSFLWYEKGVLDLSYFFFWGLIITVLISTMLPPMPRRIAVIGTYVLYFAVSAVIFHGTSEGWVFFGAFAFFAVVVSIVLSAKRDLKRMETVIYPRSL